MRLPLPITIIEYELRDLFRSKWIIVYALFFGIVTDVLFRFGGDSSKVFLSLMNLVLIIIPLVSIIFGTMYLYHSREFVELLLAQPLGRGPLFRGMIFGLALPLAAAFAIGVSVPYFYHSPGAQRGIFTMLIIVGSALTFIFIGLAFWAALLTEDRAKGFGLSILIWLSLAVVYDGLVLLIVFLLADYPLEKPLIALMIMNPIDLGRVLLLLEFDISAMLGYTGAVFRRFFGSGLGMTIAVIGLFAWMAIPFLIGQRLFIKKDF